MEWGTWEIVGSSVIGAFLLLVIVATTFDLLFPDSINKILKSFSAASNCEKIFAVSTSGTKGEITCFHAIRVLSISWVILGHQYSCMLGIMSDLKHVFEMTKDWFWQIVPGGYRAVDTFFLLGGILLTRALLKTNFCVKEQRKLDSEKEKADPLEQEENSIRRQDDEDRIWSQIRRQGLFSTVTTFLSSYFFYIFTRVMRMFPGMFLTIMFFAGPVTLFLSGPLRFTYDKHLYPCRESWWWDLTFVVNFLMRASYENETSKASCIGNSWYISVDMQMYLVMPFLILPVKLLKYKQTYLWLLVIISCAIPTAIVMANDLIPTLLNGVSLMETWEFMFKVYLMPWTRATPYFVGALVGYWLVQLERSEKTGRELMNEFYKEHPRIAALSPRLLGWLLNTAAALALVFGLVDVNYIDNLNPPRELTSTEDFFYIFLAIFGWSVVVSWVIMQCAMGLAEPLNFFLSHPMWQPLSRLTFGAYLISYPLQLMVYSTFQEYIYVNHNMIFLTWIGIIWLSYAAAFALSLLVESPVINLLRLLKKK